MQISAYFGHRVYFSLSGNLFLAIRQSFFFFQNNPKNLDLSYKLDLARSLGLFRKGKTTYTLLL